MSNLFQAIVSMLSAGVFAIIGVLLWGHAEGAAEFFRKTGSMFSGDETVRPARAHAALRTTCRRHDA